MKSTASRTTTPRQPYATLRRSIAAKQARTVAVEQEQDDAEEPAVPAPGTLLPVDEHPERDGHTHRDVLHPVDRECGAGGPLGGEPAGRRYGDDAQQRQQTDEWDHVAVACRLRRQASSRARTLVSRCRSSASSMTPRASSEWASAINWFSG